MTEFGPKTLEYLNEESYVYALRDSTTSEVFYIGKGTGNRVFRHTIEAQDNRMSETKKLERIHMIEQSGGYVENIILHDHMSDKEAFAAEAALINLLRYLAPDALVNFQSGHHAAPAMLVECYEEYHGAVELPINDICDKVIIIKINKLYRSGLSLDELKEKVRGHWRINRKRANQAKYIFAVYLGWIVGVYKVKEWFPSTEVTPMFPRPEEIGHRDLTNRSYCVCETVPPDSEDGKRYFHKTISSFSKSTQNPISYIGSFL